MWLSNYVLDLLNTVTRCTFLHLPNFRSYQLNEEIHKRVKVSKITRTVGTRYYVYPSNVNFEVLFVCLLLVRLESVYSLVWGAHEIWRQGTE